MFARRLFAFLVCVSLAAPALAADNELTAEEKAAGWQLLFNGKDTTGWKCNTDKPIATKVEDGALAPFKSGGYLIVYDKPFGDFILKCDAKMGDDNCNSGVFFRVGDLTKPVDTGMEMQVLSGKGTDMHSFGAIYDLVPPTKNNAKANDWNQIEIKAVGPLVTVKVNGEEVSTINCDDYKEYGKRTDGTKHKFPMAIKDAPRTGYLGFQDHNHKAWYKNVKLLELKGDSKTAK